MSADNRTPQQVRMWEAALEKGMELHAGCLMAVEMGTSETSEQYKAALLSTASAAAAAILEAQAEQAEEDAEGIRLMPIAGNATGHVVLALQEKAAQLRGAIPKCP